MRILNRCGTDRADSIRCEPRIAYYLWNLFLLINSHLNIPPYLPPYTTVPFSGNLRKMTASEVQSIDENPVEGLDIDQIQQQQQQFGKTARVFNVSELLAKYALSRFESSRFVSHPVQ